MDLQAVDGDVAGELAQIGTEIFGAVRGHGVPRRHPCVVDAFLGVGRAVQNVHGDRVAVRPVLLLADLYGILVTGVVEVYDLMVVEDHNALLSWEIGRGEIPVTYIHSAGWQNVP